MKLVQIYECLCDETRLRVLHLLTHTPLCVCHLQAILREPQIKISKHLAYLKARGMVEVTRHRNWSIYGLPANPPFELQSHLKCLQDCIRERQLFRDDLKRLQAVTAEAARILNDCCAAEPATGAGSRSAKPIPRKTTRRG